MPRPAVGSFKYQMQDINNSVRRTRTLLMALNGIRNVIRDVSDVMKKPTLTNIMWTLMHLMRVYRRLDRLDRLIVAEAARSKNLMKFLVGVNFIQPAEKVAAEGIGVSEGLGSFYISMRSEAFMNNMPMALDRIDFTGLTEEMRNRLQSIFEDDAEMVVIDARSMLNSRIIDKDRSTGTLENSIGWTPETDGVRITADAYYADWVESGHATSGAYFPGHHFMEDAFNMAKSRLSLKVKAELDSLIK